MLACGQLPLASADGGDVCESNAPETFCVPHNGFEDRGTHQGSIRPHSVSAFRQYNRAFTRYYVAFRERHPRYGNRCECTAQDDRCGCPQADGMVDVSL